MADRNFKRVQALDNATKLVSGNFSTVTGTPTKNAGLGWTVAGTGTGEYTITLVDKYPTLIAAHATIEVAGGTALDVQIESTDVSSAGTVIVNTVNAGTPTDVNCTLHFTLVLNNSTVA